MNPKTLLFYLIMLLSLMALKCGTYTVTVHWSEEPEPKRRWHTEIQRGWSGPYNAHDSIWVVYDRKKYRK